MAWVHTSPIPGHRMEADLDCSGLDFAAKLMVAGDFDGDGRADITVYNPSGAWSVIQSSTSTINVVGHGGAEGDVPLN